MSDAILYSASKHVLIQAIEDKRRESLLQIVILRGVNADDDGLLAVPQALVRSGQLEEAVVGQVFKAPQQRS